jgi:cobyrinic acid a,c-diamide synthase
MKEAKPRIVISAPHRSSGKSTVSLGLCAAFRKRGVVVQPFKKGPDFIDPMWLTAAAGRECRNLDFFIMGREKITETFGSACRGAELNIIEGNMGLYDGLDLEGADSTAALARFLGAPVLLVVNALRMTRGVAPLIFGYETFEPETNIAGVILNRVRGARHEKKLREAVSRYCSAEVVGVIPDEKALFIQERHLGLTPVREDKKLPSVIEKIADAVSRYVHLDRVLAIARAAPPGDQMAESSADLPPPDVRIGIASDPSFTFYYPENLLALQQGGAALVPFHTFRDPELPTVNALYIGGGFPEIFMAQLEGNASLRAEIRAAVEAGMPVYAECGGLMYLSRSISYRGETRAMVGALPCDVTMHRRPKGHGYVILETTGLAPWLAAGREVRAHEFHHSTVANLGKVAFAYRLKRGEGIDGSHDGLLHKNVLAAYTHLHAAGDPQWARSFVSFVRRTGFQQKRSR